MCQNNQKTILFCRQFRDSDAKAVSDLVRECLVEVNSKFYPDSVIKKMVTVHTPEYFIKTANERLVLVAEQFDEIIGTATTSDNFFGSVFVKPKFEGKGIGKKLIQTLEQLAKNSGQNEVKLHASVNAVGFYEKLGYQRGNLISDEIFGKSYEMAKNI